MLAERSYLLIKAEWKTIELLPIVSCHSMTLALLDYLRYLPQLLPFYQV